MCFSKLPYRTLALALLVSILAACGGGSAPAESPAPPAANNPPSTGNVLKVSVDAGPAGSGSNVNRLYAEVTVCVPGSTTQCQTIDHVLVDTGSAGLRLLSSALDPALNLSRLSATGGLPLLNCIQFIDNSFAWGPVVSADIVLAGKSAPNVPLQVIADPAFNSLAAACSVGGTAITSAAVLGANGVLGIGMLKEDCGPGCTFTTANGFYYTCTSPTCVATAGTRASIARQVKNPVALFATDNNGLLVDLPAVSAAGAASLSGSVIFGIGTQSNNQFTPGTVLKTSASGYTTTVLEGRSLTTSFIDTGSNGLYFDSLTLPACQSHGGFYCPDTPTALLATQVGVNGLSVVVPFSIDNASAHFSDPTMVVLPALGGPIGDALTFDWGLPFFYGRRVFMGIEGQTSPIETGPFYAF